MLRTREERDHLARQWRKYEATEKPWDYSVVTGSETTFNLYITSGVQVAVQQG